jgi:hypothetical protein
VKLLEAGSAKGGIKLAAPNGGRRKEEIQDGTVQAIAGKDVLAQVRQLIEP